MNSNPDGSRVGYGNPPRDKQWKPGQCGNLKGRPRKLRTVADDLHDALKESVPIKGKGRSPTITLQALILRNLARDAARGNLSAARLLFTLIGRYEFSKETAIHVGDLEAADRAILDAYVAAARDGGDEAGNEG